MIGRNHGHFGRGIAEIIRAHSREEINNLINNEYKVFEDRGVDNKRGNTAAGIAVGCKFAKSLLNIGREFPYDVVCKNVKKLGEISNAARSTNILFGWINGNLSKFREEIDYYGTTWGALTRGEYGERYVSIQISKLRELCEQLNISCNSIVKYCAEEGLIDTRGGTARGNSKTSVVSFRYEWDELRSADIISGPWGGSFENGNENEERK